MEVRLAYSHYLADLIAETARSAGRLHDLKPTEVAAWQVQARRDTARLSARLDGSPAQPDTLLAVDDGSWTRPTEATVPDRAGGWASALRLDQMETQEVAALEYDNLLRVHDAEPELAAGLFDAPLATLERLHGLVCQGLVEPAVIGRPRRTEQAVHDGAQGMVIFNPPDHEALTGLLDGLQRWLRGDGTQGSLVHPAPVVAAIVHERLLQWQPFEAGNGRVARAAARLVLRARDFDPAGLAVPERLWAQDPSGYYGEVAATIHRRDDLTVWVERSVEVLAAALAAAVQALRPATGAPSARAVAMVGAMGDGDRITVDEYAQQLGVSRETARLELRGLVAAGALLAEPRTLGRRFRLP